jgi:hypothetical protein
MSKGAHDIFTLVFNCVGSYWQLKQMVISLFKAIKTIGQTLANKLVKLFNEYGFLENHCICQRQKVKFEYYDNCFEIYCEMSIPKFR